jgi:PncC family amidohydrolase
MSLRTSAERIGELLAAKKLTISICESCTGGMLCAAITSAPGSSRYFLGGIIAYSNTVKIGIVDINRSALEDHGAVSALIARRMALGVKKKMKSDVGVGITGIAGPGGGSKSKPVGTVYIALAVRRKTFVKRHLFKGNREAIRRAACEQTFILLEEILDDG